MDDEAVVSEIVEKLKNDEKFRTEFQNSVSKNSIEKAYRLVHEHCDAKITQSEFETHIPIIAKKLLGDTRKKLLTESGLTQIAGGVDPPAGTSAPSQPTAAATSSSIDSLLPKDVRDDYKTKIAEAEGRVSSSTITGGMNALSSALSIFTKIYMLKATYDAGVQTNTYVADPGEQQKQRAEIERIKKQLSGKV